MNQYHIYDPIGKGKHSVVYKGRRKKTIQYYAIKSVDKSQKPKVLQEVRTLHSLKHENVLQFHAWYETSNHLWLILEYCVGGDLRTLLKQDVRLPEESIHDFARDLIKALQCLHSNSVVYCDLKPSNVLLDENGRPKLCDFGLARRLSDISKLSLQQLAQAKRGTPCYMAPELFQEGGVHSFPSDLYALGCVMFECATGQPPFVSPSFNQLVSSICTDPPPPLPGSPSAKFSDLVMRLLTKDPMQRLSWQELLQHPFWRSPFRQMILPAQPAFENYVKQRLAAAAIRPELPPVRGASAAGWAGENGTSEKGGGVEKLPSLQTRPSSRSGNPVGEVNVLRISRIVRSNLRREADGDSYRQGQTAAESAAGAVTVGSGQEGDVSLENTDVELDFAERDERESGAMDNDDEGSAPATPSVSDPSVPTPLSRHDNSSTVTSPRARRDSSGDDFNSNFSNLNLTESSPMSRPEAAETPPGVGGAKQKARVVQPAQTLQPTVEALMWHSSDLGVKPIMLNRRIEKLPEPVFDKKALPMAFVSAADLVSFTTQERETFQQALMESIGGNTDTNEKLNTLSFVETLATDQEAANLLVNGPLMPLLVHTLRLAKLPGLRIRLASAMGLLIRHATVLDEELARSGIVSILGEAAKDKQDKVRRRAIASLGELLFYIATQHEQSPRGEGRKESLWQVPDWVIQVMASMLRRGEDETTQHYAVKTIENIASREGEWVARFSSPEVVQNLAAILQTSKLEHLRTTAGSCIMRLARFTQPLLPVALEALTVRSLVKGLTESGSRSQQVLLNLLNLALLAGPSLGQKLWASVLAVDRSLAFAFVAVFEGANEVLRAKALIGCLLMARSQPLCLPTLCCDSRLIQAVERTGRDKDKVLQASLDLFVEGVAAFVPPLLDQALKELERLASQGQRRSPGQRTAESTLSLFRVFLSLVTSQVFRVRLMTTEVLTQLARCLHQAESAALAFGGAQLPPPLDDFITNAIQSLEALSQGPSVPIIEHKSVALDQLLPCIAGLYNVSNSGDRRFMCFRVFSDMLSQLVEVAEGEVKQLVEVFVTKEVMPMIPRLLQDEDPMPTHAHKLMYNLLEHKCMRVSDLIRSNLVPFFFAPLVTDDPPISLPSVKLCALVAAAPEVDTRMLSQLKVVEKLGALLQVNASRANEEMVEHLLQLCRGFLEHEVTAKQGTSGASRIQDIGEMARYGEVLLSLSGNHVPQAADAAADCLVLLLRAVPKQASAVLYRSLPRFTAALETCSNCHSPALLAQLQSRLLLVLASVCQEQRRAGSNLGGYQVSGPSASAMSELENLVFKLRRSNLPGVGEAAGQAMLELQQLGVYRRT